MQRNMRRRRGSRFVFACKRPPRSEEHTSEPSHLGISYAVFCLKKKEHTSELQSLRHLVCRLLLEKKRAEGATKFRKARLRGRTGCISMMVNGILINERRF